MEWDLYVTSQTVRIATRRSPLALWQAEHVKSLLLNQYRDIRCELIALHTEGDRQLEQPLSTVGGKGLFLKELEQALLNDEADIAVHSMKDVPVRIHNDLICCTAGRRGPAQDVLVSHMPLHELNPTASFGTSSGRRRALLAHLYMRRNCVQIRGNVQTRLSKFDDGEVDALLLAEAGLARLNLDSRIFARLPAEIFIPAVGQGALAVEYRKDRKDLYELLASIKHDKTDRDVQAERKVAELLDMDCTMPFGAHCVSDSNGFTLRAIVLTENGDRAVAAQMRSTNEIEAAQIVAARLSRQGAQELAVQS